MSNKNVWCVISVPTASWAKKVFPQANEEEQIEKLWDSIFKTVRVDQPDPVDAWKRHKENLKKRMDYLNQLNLKSLHYQSALGTNLTIELPEGHLWLGDPNLHLKVLNLWPIYRPKKYLPYPKEQV